MNSVRRFIFGILPLYITIFIVQRLMKRTDNWHTTNWTRLYCNRGKKKGFEGAEVLIRNEKHEESK